MQRQADDQHYRYTDTHSIFDWFFTMVYLKRHLSQFRRRSTSFYSFNQKCLYVKLLLVGKPRHVTDYSNFAFSRFWRETLPGYSRVFPYSTRVDRKCMRNLLTWGQHRLWLSEHGAQKIIKHLLPCMGPIGKLKL